MARRIRCIAAWFVNFSHICAPSCFWISFLWCCTPSQDEEYRAKLQKSNDRSLALVKAGIDIVVAVGLLQLAPKKVNPRVTGAFGFVSSLISCYQVYNNLVIRRLQVKCYDNFLNIQTTSSGRVFAYEEFFWCCSCSHHQQWSQRQSESRKSLLWYKVQSPP